MRTKILIIDDDLVSQFATRYAIQQRISNTEILVCDNGLEALKLLSDMDALGEQFPEFIFVDLLMPTMSGWEFLDIVQESFINIGQTRIFILSAFSNSFDKKKAKEYTAIEGYFDKPITKNNIDSIIS